MEYEIDDLSTNAINEAIEVLTKEMNITFHFSILPEDQWRGI